MVEDINAFELLKEEMTTEEIHLKVNAIHRLKTVVLSIGNEDTNKKLLPYLETLIEKEDDEVLFAIAEELGSLWELNPIKTAFLPLLESLAKMDETVVREQAAKSLTTISEQLSDAEMQNVFAPLVIRLAQGEWFTGRVSSCHLFYPAYSRSNAQKEKLRKKFIELCQEDTPMIRRACAAKLGPFCTMLEKSHVLQEILPIFRQLSQDEQDTIRVLCLESLIHIAAHLSKEENQVHTLGILLAAGEDKSWKVRLAFAKNFAKFAESFGKDITDGNLIQTFTLLLTDNEAEVKNAAIMSLSQCLKNLSSPKICDFILPTLTNSYADAQVSFKAGTATALCEMAALIGKDYTMTKVMPILMELLKDDNADVRLNVTSGLIKICAVVGPDILTSNFVSQITQMTKDAQWRVKMSVFEFIGDLSISLGKDAFVKNLESVFMAYLTNTAASVREMGITKSRDLCATFKSDWIMTSYLPKVIENFNIEKQGYNYRMCSLMSLQTALPYMGKDLISEKIVPVFVKAAGDKIPNVQFCVSRIIAQSK
mmetsp:Transcript_30059/g.40710  ORF Transcript_30059/g.40710 Transcript_30059/m.40710 type:complete len:539 (+) Transcript_30059:52-1668(+)